MSSLHEVRWRLLREQLDALTEWLSAEEPPVPAMFEEQTVRLLAGAVRLLSQHGVNEKGQCKFCGWTRRASRFWRPRPRCTVYQALSRVMDQDFDVVWWELFAAAGHQVSLDAVRNWMTEREREARSS